MNSHSDHIAGLMALAIENLQVQESVAYNERRIMAAKKSLFDLKDKYFASLPKEVIK